MKEFAKHIKTFLEVFAAVGVLWGVFKFVNQSQETVKAVEKMADTMNTLAVAVQAQNDSISILSERVYRQNSQIRGLRFSFIDYLRRDKTLTTDEFYQFMTSAMQDQLKKNE